MSLADLAYIVGFGRYAQRVHGFLEDFGNLGEVFVQDDDPPLGGVRFIFPAFLEIEVGAPFFCFLDFKMVGLDSGGYRFGKGRFGLWEIQSSSW
jgi:hypothetical protein